MMDVKVILLATAKFCGDIKACNSHLYLYGKPNISC